MRRVHTAESTIEIAHLRNVLEQCGLAEHTDFMTEHSVDTEDGRLRPDAIVRVVHQ